MTIYIHETYQFLTDASIAESELKQQLKTQFGVISRRSSRLNLISLLGALHINTPQNTGVYLSSSFGSPENMHDLFLSVCKKNTPRPFNFINSINNALSFYVAQEKQLEGPNLFVASQPDLWTQPLVLAMLDLELGVVEHALVGWCHERKPASELSTKEGSHWLLLSKKQGPIILELSQGEPVSLVSRYSHHDYFYQSLQSTIELIQQPGFGSLTFITNLPCRQLLMKSL